MHEQRIDKIISKAKTICGETGGRLTEKRQRVLEVLLQAKKPLSAYDVADIYNEDAETKMPSMSVYRILDFLTTEGLVHKLNSANKYVACSHIACDHAHEISQFLICSSCQRVDEVSIPKSIINDIDTQVSLAGYTLTNPQLELTCICNECETLVARKQ